MIIIIGHKEEAVVIGEWRKIKSHELDSELFCTMVWGITLGRKVVSSICTLVLEVNHNSVEVTTKDLHLKIQCKGLVYA